MWIITNQLFVLIAVTSHAEDDFRQVDTSCSLVRFIETVDPHTVFVFECFVKCGMAREDRDPNVGQLRDEDIWDIERRVWFAGMLLLDWILCPL